MAFPSSLKTLIFKGQDFTQVPHDLHEESIVTALCACFISSSIFSRNLGDAEGKVYHHFFYNRIIRKKKDHSKISIFYTPNTNNA